MADARNQVAPRMQGIKPDRNAMATDAQFEEVKSPNLLVAGAAWAAKAAYNGLKAVGREAIMPAIERAGPQGASEIGHALYPNSVYAHGGQVSPVADAGYGIHGPADSGTGVEPAQDHGGHQVFGPEMAANDDVKIVGMSAQIGESHGYDPTEFSRGNALQGPEKDRGRSR